jgi:class 3 adenylate cyclase
MISCIPTPKKVTRHSNEGVKWCIWIYTLVYETVKIKRNIRFERLIVDALAESMTVHLMERLVRRVIPDYDLHQRSGFPENIPIPKADAAQQVYMDMTSENTLTPLIEVLIDVDRNGYMGRPVSVRLLPQILDELEEIGLYFDERYGAIIEGKQRARTIGWGVLREGFHYEFSFLRFDIVGNSNLVRKYSRKETVKAFTDVKKIIAGVVEKREGRIWSWEGDGALAAFYFGNKNTQVVLTGIEILLEIFMYNLTECPFNEPLNIRIAAHTGPAQFFSDVTRIHSETLNRLAEMEHYHTEADSLTISPSVYTDLGTKLERFFQPAQISSRNYLYRYKLEWE